MKLDDLFSIEGKVALVTGGSRGIGEMIAAGFLANGAKVYISSRKADACEAVACTCRDTETCTDGICHDEPKTVTMAFVTDQVEGWFAYLQERGVPLIDRAWLDPENTRGLIAVSFPSASCARISMKLQPSFES